MLSEFSTCISVCMKNNKGSELKSMSIEINEKSKYQKDRYEGHNTKNLN